MDPQAHGAVRVGVACEELEAVVRAYKGGGRGGDGIREGDARPGRRNVRSVCGWHAIDKHRGRVVGVGKLRLLSSKKAICKCERG